MLVADRQFILLLDVPIQDRAQQLHIYEIFHMPVPLGDASTKYEISGKYIGITYDETQVVINTEQQYSTCLHANGQCCKIDAPFQALTNLLTCIRALYTKNGQEIVVQCSLSIFYTPPTFPPIVIILNLWTFILTPTVQGSAITMICPDKATHSSPFPYPEVTTSLSDTSRYFHLPLHYEDHMMTIHVSLNKANLDAIKISTPDLHIWQHFGNNWTTAHIQELADIPEIPVTHLYKYIIGHSELILSFEINRDTEEGPSLTWKLLTHPGTYIGTISMIFSVCIGVYYIKKILVQTCNTKELTLLSSLITTCYWGWWCRGSTHLQKQRHSWKPIRPHGNHDLHMEWEATRLESCCRWPGLSKAVPSARSLATQPKSRECNKNDWLIERLRIWPLTWHLFWIGKRTDDSHLLILEHSEWSCK